MKAARIGSVISPGLFSPRSPSHWRWTHPSVFDPDGEISFSLGLQGTPSTFVLDRQHRIVTRIVGETDLAGFERGLTVALEES